jgi:hypothetical protein
MVTMIDQARVALEAKTAAEQDLARLASCPPWRHAAFAGVMAALVGSSAVAMPLRFAILAVVFAAIALIVQSDRRRLGVFVNGYRRGRTRLVAIPMLVIVLLLHAASFHYGVTLGKPGVSLGLAGVAFGVGYSGSILWQRVFVRELGA